MRAMLPYWVSSQADPEKQIWNQGEVYMGNPKPAKNL